MHFVYHSQYIGINIGINLKHSPCLDFFFFKRAVPKTGNKELKLTIFSLLYYRNKKDFGGFLNHDKKNQIPLN